MEVNNKYYIQLTAITPLCVGAGNDAEWVKCADYVIKDKKVYVLDLHRAAESGIDMAQLSILFINQDHDGIVKLLGNKIEEVSSRIFDLPCQANNNIKTFERSQLHDLPVVAGSSLKGAIRSVLFQYLRQDEQSNKEVFGAMDDGTDFMRFIKIGDFEMPDTILYNSKIFNLHIENGAWIGGWKHAKEKTTNRYLSTGFNSFYECVAPGKTGIGTIMLSHLLFDKVSMKSMAYKNKKKELLSGNNIKNLFAIINKYTENYLRKEREFFTRYHAERVDQIIDNIDQLLKIIPSDNSYCLLKMSAGVGFHAITGDWQYEDYTDTGYHDDKEKKNAGKKKYKSRKIVETPDGRLMLMGFIKLTDMQDILRQKEEQKAQEEALKTAATEKENKYNALIEESLAAEQSGDYLLARDKAQEASDLFEHRQEHKDIIVRLKAKETAKEAEKKAKEAEDVIAKTREEKASGGLSALLNEKYEQGPNEGKHKVLTFKVCLQKVSSWMKAAEVTALPDAQQPALVETIERLIADPDKKELRDIKNRKSSIWKKIEEFLSCQQADELYSKLK